MSDTYIAGLNPGRCQTPTSGHSTFRRIPTGRPRRVSIDRVSDADLVQRARSGDRDAFGELVERHRTAVYRAALAALGSPADAEDAAQDAFVLAYRRLDSFRGNASFKTWLLTITWNQAMNRRRSLARLWRHLVQPTLDEDPDAALIGAAAFGPSPEQLAATVELRDAIRRAIRALPATLRDALLLAQSGSYSYDEIA
ncbi:MAG TPA: sigma-70 family RNA polymerase sigma factor, partial [Rhodanobacteraceae bacterium]